MRWNNDFHRENEEGDANVSAAATNSLRCTTSAYEHMDAHLMSRNNEVPGEKDAAVYILYFTWNLPIISTWDLQHELNNTMQRFSLSIQHFYPYKSNTTYITVHLPPLLRILHHFNALQMRFQCAIIWVICISSLETTKRTWMGCLKTSMPGLLFFVIHIKKQKDTLGNFVASIKKSHDLRIFIWRPRTWNTVLFCFSDLF